MTQKEENLLYSIKFDIPKNKKITPAEFVKGMEIALNSLEEFNHAIVSGIGDDTIQVVSYIEELEGGSIIYKLRDKIFQAKKGLEKVSDEEIEEFSKQPRQKSLAYVLKKSKTFAIAAMNKVAPDEDFEERKMRIINPIVKEIEDHNKKFQDGQMELGTIKLNQDKLLLSVSHMSDASKALDGAISFSEDADMKEQLPVAQDFHFSPRAKEEIKYEDKILSENESEDYLVLLTPNYKENCKWVFEYGEEQIHCDIKDQKFWTEILTRTRSTKARDVYKVKRKVIKLLVNGKQKKQHEILEVLGIEDETKLFRNENDN